MSLVALARLLAVSIDTGTPIIRGCALGSFTSGGYRYYTKGLLM